MKIADQVNATKERIEQSAALSVLDGVNQLYVAKGKKVTHVNLKKDRPADDDLVKLLVGPTGNLRAPTLRRGKTLIVGFNAETYAEIFG